MVGIEQSRPDLWAAVGRCPVIPVVTMTRADGAEEVAGALAAGGVAVMEVTLRAAGGLESIERLRDRDDVVVGAGTVSTEQEAIAVLRAGARFVVSPGLDAGIVRHCQDQGVPVLPGIATPSEAMAARALGIRTTKVFPAGSLGGPAFVRALAALWPDQRYVPTGGISLAEAPAYLAIPSVIAVGGSWMVPADAIAAQDWSRISTLAAEAAALGGAA